VGKGDGSSSIEILKYEDSYIELIEKCPCVDKSELHRKEGEIIRLTDNAVNKYIAGRNRKEYSIENKEVIAIRMKKYREANKEVLNEKSKEYREANKEVINEKRREYYGANRDKINEKIECELCKK
jgi:hypothetical protein